jgi:GT2 family glycosyltransferase
MYIEDVDICLRVKRQGWRVVYLPAARVIHYGGHSSAQRGLPRLNGMLVPYVTSARYHYVVKNYGRPWLWLLRAANALSGLCWIGLSFLAGSADRRKEQRAIGRALLTTRPPEPRQAAHASDMRQPM